MVAIHKSGDSSPNNSNIYKKSINPQALKEKLDTVSATSESVVAVAGTSTLDVKNDLNEIIFNTKIAEVPAETFEEESSDEEVHLLPREIQPVQTKNFDCSGSDWGLSWPLLLGLVLFTAFVIPLVYVLYIAEHPNEYHNHLRHHS